MKPQRSKLLTLLLAFSVGIAGTLVPADSAEADRRGKHYRAHGGKWHHDARFGHNRHYYRRGHVVHGLPRGHRHRVYGGVSYYHYGGVYYRPHSRGYVVVGPPIGAFVSVLPPFYTTIYLGGTPYYYANRTYYVYDRPERVYRVVERPSGVEDAAVPASDIFVYPKEGQGPERQAKDRYECHRWAAEETGFDPSLGEPTADSVRSDYYRAMTACLEARGYSVK